ncbi:MAG: ATP-binding cassette domain-containing protein [Alphaproteobacteria bacterium]|nr:ATP-binding cassette domain-containing protein [Alphaproteobacteria bacterium]
MLIASGIEKSFGNKQVLRGVDIAIAPGEITCVIGPSGTGKTTLLRALALLDYPDKGSVEIDGRIHEFPGAATVPIEPPWPHLTVVFQSLFLWPHLTLRENIMLPARGRNPDAAADIEELISFFEMGNFIENYPNQASVGQRQRVALARALILNPRYILMDEITSALDVEQTVRILAKLSTLKERGIGVFLITHALNFARKAADRIVFMDEGKIVEQGPSSILTRPQTPRFTEFLSLVEAAH